MKAVGRVDDLGTGPALLLAEGGPGDECRDRRVDVNQVVFALPYDIPHRAGGGCQIPDVKDVSRPGGVVNLVELRLALRAIGRLTRHGIHLPAQRSEMPRKGKQKCP
jgi:hypothetical protein